MNKYRTLLLVSTVVLASGCSTLDSSSSFDDVARQVKERHNYVQVIAKDFVPESKAIMGADVVKSSLFYVGNFSKDANAKVKESYIDMNVTSFKTYDHFDSVTINDQRIALQDYRPQAETCTEHCTVTQWFQFPLTIENISHFDSENVEFTLASKTDKNVVKFFVPKAYFDAVKNEAMYIMDKQPSQSVKMQEQPVVGESKTEEMVQYWFTEGSTGDQKEFADWAFSQRSSVTEMIQTSSKPVEMMAYWYEKADKNEKSNILSWLIRQE